jgi:carbonic anhydrase
MKKRYKSIQGHENLWVNGEKELFKQHSEGQPDVLYIACSDSRVTTGNNTHSMTGELSVLCMRPIEYVHSASENTDIIGLSAGRALVTSSVTDIVVCGYSNCGSSQHADASDCLRQQIVVQENVFAQLKRIASFHFVERAVEDGDLCLHGWNYDMYTGKAFAFNSGTLSFEEIFFT